jgi:hypothetical protein
MKDKMLRIAAMTTSRNDGFFAAKWLDYYGRELGKENLYMFLDGRDQAIPENAGPAHVKVIDHETLSVAKGDKKRVERVNDLAATLFEEYDIVIGCDVDEYLAVDPFCGFTLSEYLGQLKHLRLNATSVSALGVDVGQKVGTEPDLALDRPVLEQRRYAVLCSRYTKPVVMLQQACWGSGYHRIEGHGFHIDPNLFLFHFGYCDLALLKARRNDSSRIEAGWERHLGKRARTIAYCTNSQARNGDECFASARALQDTFRPLYALNKPGSIGSRTVIIIPDRFRSLGI